MTEGHDPYNHVGRLMKRHKFDCQVWLTPEEIASLNRERIKVVESLFRKDLSSVINAQGIQCK